MSRIILVTGATGKQGGALLQNLEGTDFRLRALTRKPDSDAARALAARGVEVVAGDLDDEDALRAALRGAWGVFGVQNTWEAGVEQEEVQGKRLVRLAAEAGVSRFVYASVGSAHLQTGIPHFDNKGRVEEAVQAAGFSSYVIFRPVFFMENLLGGMFIRDGVLAAALRPETKLQMVACADLGRIYARAFTHAGAFQNVAIDIAGDDLTMPEAVAILSRAWGQEIRFQPLPIEAVRAYSEDLAAMFAWFERVGYSADIPALERRFGPMTTLAAWAKDRR